MKHLTGKGAKPRYVRLVNLRGYLMNAIDWVTAGLVSAAAYGVLIIAGYWIFGLGYRGR